MQEIQNDPRLKLQVVVGTHLFYDYLLWYLRHGEPASLLKAIPWYLKARMTALLKGDEGVFQLDHLSRILRADGFFIEARLPLFLEGGNLRVMAKTTAFGLLGLPDIFERLKPDVVLINGDRFEMLPIAFSTVASNIRLAHLEGGDVSGTLDESTRHAITKLAHFHFPATETSGARIRAMGENPRSIFMTGSPVIDTIAALDRAFDNSVFKNYRPFGVRVDVTRPYLLVVQHPVTTAYESNYAVMQALVAAIQDIALPTIFISPNIDAGSDGISVATREFRDVTRPPFVMFAKHFSTEDFSQLLAHAAVAIGNSSSLIREGAFFGTPAVVVGDRQKNRERGENVIEVSAERSAIRAAIEKQQAHGLYPRDTMFGDGTAAKKIVEVLASRDLATIPLQKQFFEL